jgi:hypothetical protein
VSAGSPPSFGEELIRIIRAEINDYDIHKKQQAEIERLQHAAQAAASAAENAVKSAEQSAAFTPLIGGLRARSLDNAARRIPNGGAR